MMNRSDDFDEQEEMGEHAPAHIWLRYATQFTSGERSYTIDIGIPVPLGADAGTREQLLREADAGLDQLADYVERRVMQVAQQTGSRPSAPARPATPPIPAPTPVAAPTPISLPASAPAAQPVAHSAGLTGSTGRPQTPAAQVSPVREGASASSSQSNPVSPAPPKKQAASPAAAAAPAIAVPPSRPNIAASMPPSPGLPGGTLSLPEFLKYLKEMGLDAKGAMALLKVKSLSGLNLREALEQLQHILMQESTHATAPGTASTAQAARVPTGSQAPAQKQPSSSRPASGESHSASNPSSPANSTGSSREKTSASGTNRPGASVSQPPQSPQQPPSTPAARSTAATPPASHSTPVSTSASSRQGSAVAPTAAPPVTPAARPSPAATPAVNGTRQATGGPQSSVLHEGKPPYPPLPVVFDEEEDDADLEDLFDEDEDEDLEAAFGTGAGLSAANRGSAEDIVSRLREVGGSSPVSLTRLKVLHNIVDGQLTPEQLQALIHGVWGTASDKKLKAEQAEELISWGKQDEFVTEAEMVLALFEEDGNASSNR